MFLKFIILCIDYYYLSIGDFFVQLKEDIFLDVFIQF